MQMVQKLKHTDYQQCMVFCEPMLTMMLRDNFQVNGVSFSDEAHFDLQSNTNHQNLRYNSEENDRVTCEKALHSPCVTVWQGSVNAYIHTTSSHS